MWLRVNLITGIFVLELQVSHMVSHSNYIHTPTHPRHACRYFSEGALDLYNCPTVLVSESQLLHNGPFTSGNLLEYRGDSAGLSVGEQHKDNVQLSKICVVVSMVIFKPAT